jgi:hypothetical protein
MLRLPTGAVVMVSLIANQTCAQGGGGNNVAFDRRLEDLRLAWPLRLSNAKATLNESIRQHGKNNPKKSCPPCLIRI